MTNLLKDSAFVKMPVRTSQINKLVTRKYDYGRNYRPKLIIQTAPSSYVTLGFARGNIDNYAVFVHYHRVFSSGYVQLKEAPWTSNFKLITQFQRYAFKDGFRNVIIRDFLAIYNHTNNYCNPKRDWLFSHLGGIAKHYPRSCLTPIYLAILYLAMISECHYQRCGFWGRNISKIGKRIKFISFYKAIVMGWNVYLIKRCLKNKSYQYLLNLYLECQRNIRHSKFVN